MTTLARQIKSAPVFDFIPKKSPAADRIRSLFDTKTPEYPRVYNAVPMTYNQYLNIPRRMPAPIRWERY